MAQDPRSVRTEQLTDLQAELVTGSPQALVSPTNPLPVTVVEGKGVSPQAYYAASAALAAQATATVAPTAAIAPGVTGRLQKVLVSAEVPFVATIEKFDGTTATTIGVLHGSAGHTEEFVPVDPTAALYAQAGAAGAKYRVQVKNNNLTGLGAAAAIHVTLEWDEA